MKTKTAMILLLAALATAGAAQAPGPAMRVAAGNGFAVELSADGRIAAVSMGGLRRAVAGETRLAGGAANGPAAARALAGGGVEFARTLTDGRGNACRLIERFLPRPESVRWEIEITGEGAPWSAAVETILRYPQPWRAKLWAPWSDPRQGRFQSSVRADLEAAGAVAAGRVGDWADPLVPMPFTGARLWFGAPAFSTKDPGLFFIPFQPDLFGIPLATVLEEERDWGLSLALSPDDPILDLSLTTAPDGEIAFARLNHRIEAGAPLRFAADLVAHEADWRGGLRWMAARYPEYFDPAVAGADELAGTGAYSAYEGPLDAAKLKRMAFRTNWKASWDFPYMGLFLPPVAEGESWTRFGGNTTSIPAIRDYIRRMRADGFFVLNYFNVTEFGAKILWPPPAYRPLPEAETWRDANTFTYKILGPAVLRVPTGTDPARLRPRTNPDGPYYTWEGGIVTDPGESVYKEFLLDQARRHVAAFPESSGICIDRMDWLRMYNTQRDDGVTWFEGRPARALVNSWRGLMAELGPIFHKAGQSIFVNNHTKRIDLLKATDGFFDEFTYRGAPLNLTALMAVRKPALGWTDSSGDIGGDPDAFFQKYLYLGVYPMAPFPENDHSLVPDPATEKAYLDYGPLLDALRGKKWVLSPHACRVEGSAAKANLFRVADGYAVPVVYAGGMASARVVLKGVDATSANATALHPGSDRPVPVRIVRRGADFVLEVPFVRGCAVVKIGTRRPTAP